MADQKALLRLMQGAQQPQYTPEQIAEFQRLQAQGSGQAQESMGPMDIFTPGAGAGIGLGIGGAQAMRYGMRHADGIGDALGMAGAQIGGVGGIGYLMDIINNWKRREQMNDAMPPVPPYPPRGPTY